MFSTDKTAPMEYATFVNTVMAEDVRGYNMGLYDDYIEFLQGTMAPKFYQRHTIYKTDTQVENFWNDLISEARDMLANPRVYPQPSRFSCNSCLYRVPCDGKNRGEDYKYTLDTLYIGDRL
jgi:MoaA/NifB/PqqE/SkfB family radical SAM enzyme